MQANPTLALWIGLSIIGAAAWPPTPQPVGTQHFSGSRRGVNVGFLRNACSALSR